jgi:germination protein YpeB
MDRTRRKRALEIALAALIVLTVALGVFSIAQQRRVQALTIQINAAYQKAFFETTELLGGAQINMEKLLVSATASRQRSLLIEILKQADGARDNFALMPIGNETIAGALKFVNQLGDYCRVLAEATPEGERLSEEALGQISILHAHCEQLNIRLYDVIAQYERGEPVFSVSDVENTRILAQTPVEPAVDYPVLLYDGPFSDASDAGRLTELGAREVTMEEAREVITAYIGAERVQAIAYTGESELLTACYEFSVTVEEGVLDASVTKRGGKVLYILPEQGEQTQTLSPGECIDHAALFLARNGYGEMKVSYFRQLGGLLTVNFAAVQDGVILYPDLIKLQVSMRTGLVVGVEAGNYLRNHAPRAFPEVKISQEDALRRVSDALGVSSTRLTLIPVDRAEVLCWEASAYRMDTSEQYLIYIDAVTGQEAVILHLTQDDEGYVTQ